TALERRLEGVQKAVTDEQALRRELDEGPGLTLLALADALEEDGRPEVASGLRWLAEKGKWPGAVDGRYRWQADSAQYHGNASWSLPPMAIALLRDAPPVPGASRPNEY